MLALALAASTPLLIADEKSWLHVPDVEEFRVQAIARTAHERDWPFAVDAGFLACAYVLGSPAVSFVEKLPEGDYSEPRAFILSTNPLDLAFAGVSASGLLKPTADLETLIRAIAPFQQAGEKLCQQPQGAAIGSGEI
ncbi:MAG TPA: hypothetical protein VGN97_09640 [Mesorhizobium sp.]|jgi:hypothetical protein|nr:hypothetical protein [Mesorhizobium sp.]